MKGKRKKRKVKREFGLSLVILVCIDRQTDKRNIEYFMLGALCILLPCGSSLVTVQRRKANFVMKVVFPCAFVGITSLDPCEDCC
jgi:hypothetical protein